MKQRKTILILTLILVTAFLLIGCFVNKDSSSKTTNGNVKETKETVEQPETEPKTELTEPIHVHTWQEATCTTAKICTECGETDGVELGHTEVAVEGKEATCVEDGISEGKKCSVCDIVILEQQVIPASGHKEETIPGKVASCFATGLSEGKKCSVCNIVLVEQESIPESAHKEVTVPAQAATCTDTGLTEGKKCSVCDAVIEKQKTVSAKGHKEVTISGKAATCTAQGSTDGKKCSVCNVITVKQQSISAKGHKEVTIASKAATCTEGGLTEGKKCSVCNTILEKQQSTPAAGHKEVVVPGKEPTCSEAGYMSFKKCSVCGIALTTPISLSTLDHTWSAWTVGKSASCNTNGYYIRRCSVCGSEERDTIPATGKHNYVNGKCSCGDEIVGTKGLTYKLSDDGTYYICTGYSGYTYPSKIIIPPYYNGKPVKSIDAVGGSMYVFLDTFNEIKEIIISEGIEIIGPDFIYGASKLTSITIPSSVKCIDGMAFSGCSNLEKVYINTYGWSLIYKRTGRNDGAIDFSNSITAANTLRKKNYGYYYQR